MFSNSPCFLPANTIGIYNIYPSTEQLLWGYHSPTSHICHQKCIYAPKRSWIWRKGEHMCHAHGCLWDTGTWRDRKYSMGMVPVTDSWDPDADDESLLQLEHLCQHWPILEVSGNKTLEYARICLTFFSFPLIFGLSVVRSFCFDSLGSRG